jgi:hypothetical protein
MHPAAASPPPEQHDGLWAGVFLSPFLIHILLPEHFYYHIIINLLKKKYLLLSNIKQIIKYKKMKKIFCVLAVMFVFASCGKDDKKDEVVIPSQLLFSMDVTNEVFDLDVFFEFGTFYFEVPGNTVSGGFGKFVTTPQFSSGRTYTFSVNVPNRVYEQLIVTTSFGNGVILNQTGNYYDEDISVWVTSYTLNLSGISVKDVFLKYGEKPVLPITVSAGRTNLY